jgi:hypothetical protein
MTNYNNTLNLNEDNATDPMPSAGKRTGGHLNDLDAHTKNSVSNFNVGSQVTPISVKKVDQGQGDNRRDVCKRSIEKIADAPGPRSPRPDCEGVGG